MVFLSLLISDGSEELKPFLIQFWIVVAGIPCFLATKLTFLRLSTSLRISTFSSSVYLFKDSPFVVTPSSLFNNRNSSSQFCPQYIGGREE